MRKDEELEQLRAENRALREALQQKDSELEQSQQGRQDLREGLKQALIAIGLQQERVTELEGLIDSLQERLKTLERQQAKDSHNSNLPPSSDRFVRAPKSLRKPSGKKAGGQAGHRGHHQASGCRRLMRCSFIPSANARTASTICVPNQPACLSDAR